MNPSLNILLFAHPRSGSTTLMQILNLHPEIHLMHEPFNEEHEKWAPGNRNYLRETHTIADLDRALGDIHKIHNGFKHLSYQLPEALTKHLLQHRGYKIIFLRRKNHLQSVVSTFMAMQTGVWTYEEKEQKGIPHVLAPLDIGAMRREIEHLKHELTTYYNMMRDGAYVEVVYEALFDAEEAARLQRVREIFSFLGLRFPIEKMKEIETLLSPKRKMTDEKTLRRIPNIQQVEQELGSKENGFLFR